MFVIIVGGGKVGSYLARALLKRQNEVVVVEKQERKATILEHMLEQRIAIVGDGCDPLVLEQAGAVRADVIVADTGDDEDNLVVCLIATRLSQARCIARVNNPANKRVFESLDTSDRITVISTTEIILDAVSSRIGGETAASA